MPLPKHIHHPEDPFVARIEICKKRILAIFPLASLLLALVSVLFIEAAGVGTVVQNIGALHQQRPSAVVQGPTSPSDFVPAPCRRVRPEAIEYTPEHRAVYRTCACHDRELDMTTETATSKNHQIEADKCCPLPSDQR